MADGGSSRPTQLFAAIPYRCFDFELETSTWLKVVMARFALSAPPGSGGRPGRRPGSLREDAYRRPWTRGSIIATCKLPVTGSILEDLRGMGRPVTCLERLGVGLSQVNGGPAAVVPSSHPNSRADSERVEVSISTVPCEESFGKITPDQMCPTDGIKDVLLPEEVMIADPLPPFKRHLPMLRAMLSRLRNLPVSDPLFRSSGNNLSEETIIRHCASYEAPTDIENFQSVSNEEFSKENVNGHECLLLPVWLDSHSLERQDHTHFQYLLQTMNVAPEHLEEQLSLLDVLHEVNLPAAQLAADISHFDVPKVLTAKSKTNGSQIDSHSAGRLVLPTEMELDLTLSPPPTDSLTPSWASCSQLHMEEMSPAYRQNLMSEKDHKEMELVLWKAEKHPNQVLSSLLTEPQTCDPGMEFHPLSEAREVLKMHGETFASIHDSVSNESEVPELYFSNFCEFTESMTSELHAIEEDVPEDFTTLSPEHIEHILRVCEENSFSGIQAKSILKNPSRPAQSCQQEVSATCTTSQNKDAQNCQTITTTSDEKPKSRTMVLSAASASSQTDECHNRLMVSECAARSAGPKEILRQTARPGSGDEVKPEQRAKSTRPRLRGSAGLQRPEKDPLSTFMMLRSQQTAHHLMLPQESSSLSVPKGRQSPSPQLQSQRPLEWKLAPDQSPLYVNGVIAGKATRVQQRAAQQTAPCQPVTQDKQGSRVIQVQATESVWHAYCELLALAQPCLSKARDLGLSSPGWRDFSHLAPDQTRFLLKQQEKELCRTQGEDKELLFNQVALVHVLVTVKHVLLKCDLNTAVEYLTQAAVACAGHSLENLVKRLQILVWMSHRNQEPNLKLLELQDQLVTWFHSRNGQNSAEKVVIITAAGADGARATLIRGLAKVLGEALTAVSPEEGEPKLNAATVLNSVQSSACLVLCGQHIGAGFPWHCFSLAVEYDHPGYSPWAAVCAENNVGHLAIQTSLSNPECETPSWSFEESVPYVLLVTEGLLNNPLLLQILESTYHVTVLERSFSASLQMLGGTHHYAVLTVDESTVVLIQDQEELAQDRCSERVLLRLTALSLQYSSCWLILHCPGSHRGLSSEEFRNLVLINSSLVLFGKKAEDLDVKVLLVSEVEDIARWIRRICFYKLMSSDREPLCYLDRQWLAAMPSEEENCLCLFPCVNPLVSQLMLRRAPSLQWLLGASLSELNELLPEVPHKVLKLFSDITSSYRPTSKSYLPTSQNSSKQSSPCSPWTSSPFIPHPDSESRPNNLLSRDVTIATSYREPDRSMALQDTRGDSQVEQRFCFGGSDFGSQNISTSWTKNPWSEEEEEEEEEEKKVKIPVWKSGRGAVGGVVERVEEGRFNGVLSSGFPKTHHSQTADLDPFQPDILDSGTDLTACSAERQMFLPSEQERLCVHYHVPGLRPPADTLPWEGRGVGQGGGRTLRVSDYDYGSICWMGQEAKRSAEVSSMLNTEFPPLKRRKLSYERVPGRSDGQTRLRFL